MSDDDDLLDPATPPPLEPPTGEAADPKKQRRKQLSAKQVKREAERFWRDVLANPIGRREIWGLIQVAHTFQEQLSVTPMGFPDQDARAYARGERDFGLRFYLKLLKIDRAGVALMHDEHDPNFREDDG